MKLLYGVGINDADYVVRVSETIGYVDGKQKRKIVWSCPFYATWTYMLRRAYSEKLKVRQPAYNSVKVCKEWHLFSTFKSWMETQDWEGKQLDKDLLIRGNKVYSPETCVFVSRQVNNFIVDQSPSRGAYMIGVCWHKKASKFIARCCNPFTGKLDHLGLFIYELDAHNAWLKHKLYLAHELASIQTDKRVALALINYYENY